MPQNKLSETLLVQAYKLRRMADAMEQEASRISSWDDPASSREDIGDSSVVETADSAITPKEEEELLDLIENSKSSISDTDSPSRTPQNKGNNPYPKTKKKWSSDSRPLREKIVRRR